MALDIVVFIIVPVLVVLTATVLAGRRVRARGEDYDGDSVGFIGGVLSALFTVVLAFFVVFAWQTGADLSSNATAESDALLDTYWQMAVVPAPDADRIRALLRRYATEVADDEWSALARKDTTPAVSATLADLRTGLTNLPADAALVAEARSHSLENIRTMDENHRARVGMATSSDPFTLALLVGTVLGAVLMVAIPLIFGMSTRPANIAMMALLAMSLGATMYVSWQLMNPLEGFFGTSPDAFRNALDVMTSPGRG